MSVLVGLLAGTGVYAMAEKVIKQIVSSPHVSHLWVLTPTGRYQNYGFLHQPKITHIDRWLGEDSHDFTGRNREVIRQAIRDAGLQADWIWIGDEDALPADDYFDQLVQISYGEEPVLMAGKTYNANGNRWYDICSFQTDGEPFCVPYDDWQNVRWAKGLYASGNQHVMNRAGFELDVPYPDRPGEDPHYCWAFRDAGGKIVFRPELSMTLQKLHPYANPGYAPCLPPELE